MNGGKDERGRRQLIISDWKSRIEGGKVREENYRMTVNSLAATRERVREYRDENGRG